MSGEAKGPGDAAMDGLAARATSDGSSPAAGDASRLRCLNCGNFLSAHYCAGCGQPAHLYRSVGGFLHDLLHGVLHFEGKLWHTLPLLFLRPGELTRRYIDGERAHFFSPLALFLFAVFLTFAVFSIMGTGIDAGDRARPLAQRGNDVADLRTGIAQSIIQSEARIANARAAGQSTDDWERELALSRRAARIVSGPDAIDRPDTTLAAQQLRIDSGIPVIDQTVAKAVEDPELMLYKLQSNAYKFAWALIPLSAPIIWLLFPFSRRFGLYDHFIFVTYSLSFMLILLVVSRIATVMGVDADSATIALIFYPPVHIYMHVRGTYRTSRWGAAVRAVLLTLAALVMLILFMAGLLAFGAMA